MAFPAIAAGAALSGIGSIASALSGYKNESLNRDVAQYQYGQNIQLSNTAHQREVADLQAAGLNPILSATGGSGAQIPSPVGISVAPQPMDLGQSVSSAISSYRSLTEMQHVIDKIDSESNAIPARVANETELATAEINRKRSEEILNLANAHVSVSAKREKESSARRQDAERLGQLISNQLQSYLIPGAKFESRLDQPSPKGELSPAEVARILHRWSPFGSAFGVARSLGH